MKHIQIRQGVFESNSSSSHSITIDNSYDTEKVLNPHFKTFIRPGEFGWEFEKFNDFEMKLSYLWTLVSKYDFDDETTWFFKNSPNEWYCLKALYTNLKAFEQEKNVVFVKQNSENGEYSYVDHGSEHWMDFVQKYPELSTKEGIWNFVSKDSGWIFLGNDNQSGPPGCRMTPNEYSSYDYYIKIEGVEGMYPLKDKDNKTEVEEICRDGAYKYDEQKRDYDKPFLCSPYIDDEFVYLPYEVHDYKTGKHTIVRTDKIKWVILGKTN